MDRRFKFRENRMKNKYSPQYPKDSKVHGFNLFTFDTWGCKKWQNNQSRNSKFLPIIIAVFCSSDLSPFLSVRLFAGVGKCCP